MKPSTTLSFLLLLTTFAAATTAQAQSSEQSSQRKAHHVVIIWLKQHGDENARRKYIEGSKRLANLPGVLSYNIGTATSAKREHPSHALDDSYDIAISSSFESLQALENYLKHPKHHQVVQDVLKPLVDKYKVYDFVE
ncbi:Dabb family protein [Methylomarinum sp. Ch1-1]|uniref:Dabb family protein n=1 Tax=Methylomarinum roseum TaxID=3067653 RepID=A0AAU7NTT3_9GAMM|nr:Dabb family protein [Methylomarinum sp. Ch1-1]MDP4519514.1 Dabb family protein [Methylomarinum sp. Ch1-1]